MRTLMLASAAALSLVALPTALSAQQSADELNARSQPRSATMTVTPNPGTPSTVTQDADGSVTVDPNRGAPAVVTTTNPGNLAPPPQSALNKSYPVCTRRLQDNCQNPGEGGAPGKSRALGYWPGESATERRERGG